MSKYIVVNYPVSTLPQLRLLLSYYVTKSPQNLEIIFFMCHRQANSFFSLQLTVAQCSILRYRGMKCKNWTVHAPIAMQRSTIFFLFFLYNCTIILRMRSRLGFVSALSASSRLCLSYVLTTHRLRLDYASPTTRLRLGFDLLRALSLVT